MRKWTPWKSKKSPAQDLQEKNQTLPLLFPLPIFNSSPSLLHLSKLLTIWNFFQYGSDSPHLAVMNKFIRSQHERFREYFAAVCNVESPEKHFNRDEYSDFVSLGKPFISVQLRDLMNWHQELIKFEEKIAPNSEDRFHLLMIDAGRTVPVDLFNGAGLQQTDFLPLTLSSKFDVAADDLAVSKNNFLK